ncbi:MAG: zinc-ribbon domain-containing protein [Chloroflexota bacterium]
MAKSKAHKVAEIECPTCHKHVVPDDGYCPNCGAPIDVSATVGATAAPASGNGASAGKAASASTVTCPVCGMQVKAGEEFCPNCGAPLGAVLGGNGAGTAATVTPPAAVAVKCSVCGTEIPAGEDYCPSCGAPRSASVSLPSPDGAAKPEEEQLTVCPNCGAPLRPGAKFCRECGERFTGIATQKAPTDAASQIKIGQVLAGRYRIASLVGGGGMGAVFKGYDLNLKTRQEPEGRQVAVKAILNTGDAELLAQAVEEREMLIRLDHPNIVRIFDIVQERGVPYIVMAYVQGKSWKDLYEENNGPLPESEAIRLLLGIRGAFEYLHGRTPPVVYRDFKPGNVIQVEENGVKRQVLIDLGTAMEYFPGQKREAWGTVGFAPPEIGGICEQPPTMDLFAITSTLAALLGVDVNQQGIGAPPRNEWPVSPEIYDFVERGRDPDPRVRFQTVGELFDQLEGIQRFIRGQEQARLQGAVPMRGRSTSPLSNVLVPVQSTIITGRLSGGVTGKIGAFPALSSTDPAAQVLQPARDLMAAGRYSEALVQIDAALKTYPASIDGHLLRAAALNNMGLTNEAKAALDQANRLSTPATRWRTLLVQAQAAESTDDFHRAEQLYGELIKQVPGEVLPKQALADIYRQTGRYGPAADLYGRVVSADPANADAVLGWADSLVALNKTDSAINVLDAVSENALRYVDAQLRLIELYLSRIDAFLKQQGNNVSRLQPGDPNTQALVGDLSFAARAIAGLNDKTESTHYYRLQADWWYAAYRLSKAGKLPPNMEWPDRKQHKADNPAEIGESCRAAYRRYLQRAPDAPDREDVLARIYFDVDEWQ